MPASAAIWALVVAIWLPPGAEVTLMIRLAVLVLSATYAFAPSAAARLMSVSPAAIVAAATRVPGFCRFTA